MYQGNPLTGGEGISLPIIHREELDRSGVNDDEAAEANEQAVSTTAEPASNTHPSSAGVPESKDDDMDSPEVVAEDEGIFAMEAGDGLPTRSSVSSATSRPSPDEVIMLVKGLLRDRQYDLLKLFLFPLESMNDQDPQLFNKPLKEAELACHMKNVQIMKALAVIEMVIKLAKTNEDIDKIFRDNISKISNDEDLSALKTVNNRLELWRKLRRGSLPGEFTISDNTALKDYFNKSNEAFIVWMTAIFEYFIDHSRSFEANIQRCKQLLNLQDFLSADIEFRNGIIVRMGDQTNNNHSLKSARLKFRAMSYALSYNCTYPLAVEPIGLLDVIDENGNTVLHFMLSDLAAAREGAVVNVALEADIKDLIQLLPAEFQRLLKRSDASPFTTESFLSLSNKLGSSIFELATKCGEDILNLVQVQCSVGRITGKPLTSPIGIRKSSGLAKTINRGLST